MKIPKYIDRLLERRTKLAEQLNSVSTELDEWLEKSGIPTGNDYTRTGCMIYSNHTPQRDASEMIYWQGVIQSDR